MIGPASGGQRIHCGLQICNGGNELRILCGSGSEAYDADTASEANVAVLHTVCCFIYNVNELFCSVFQIGKRTSGHTAGTIQNQNDVRGIGNDIRLPGER